MTAGLIQLVSYGLQDMYLTQDPQITFFKVVYRRHTNFSIEPIQQNFSETPDFGKRVSCVVSRRGDLINNCHLVITLPRIPQFYIDENTIDPYTKIAWSRKIGWAMINYIDIEIADKLIDRHYGEWLNIWHELFEERGHDKDIDNMIGNMPCLYDYTNGKDEYILYVPLKFWFCKNSGCSLPLIGLQYSQVRISVEFNDLSQCINVSPDYYMPMFNDIVDLKPYEYIEQNVNGVIASGIFVYYDFIEKNMYYKKISQNNFQSITSSAISIADVSSAIYGNNKNFKYFIKGQSSCNYVMPKLNSTPSINTITYSQITNISIPSCFLLIDYIYVDTDERSRMMAAKYDYLIEQVIYSNQTIVSGTNSLINVNDFIHPSKMLVWVLQLSYLYNNNDLFNYTDSYMYDKNNKLKGKSLITNETIVLNSEKRISKRGYEYFNHVQPYQHFIHNPNEGINVYSFSVFPEKYQPSGTCNMSVINTIQIDISNNTIVNINNNALFRCYSLCINVLRVSNGLCSLVFIK